MLAKLEDTGMQDLASTPAVADIDLKWYILFTEPNGEGRSTKYLRKRGFDPYVPHCKKETICTVRSMFGEYRRKRESYGPIFPGYLFLPLNWAWDFGPIHVCPGLRQQGSKFMAHDGQYCTLSNRDIGLLFKIEDALKSSPLPYKVGENVRIVDGAFMDRIAEITKLDDAERIELRDGIFRFIASATQIAPL
jgi:hypothetical protein